MPEATGCEMPHRSVQCPLLKSSTASSANGSSRPAATTSSNCGSQRSASNSANQARNVAKSSAESRTTACAISCMVLILGGYRVSLLQATTRSGTALPFLFLAQLGQHTVILQRGGVLRRLFAAGDVAEQSPHDLPRAGLGQGIGETDLIRPGQGANLLDNVLAQVFLQLFGRGGSALERHEASNALPLDLIRPSHHRGLGHLL